MGRCASTRAGTGSTFPAWHQRAADVALKATIYKAELGIVDMDRNYYATSRPRQSSREGVAPRGTYGRTVTVVWTIVWTDPGAWKSVMAPSVGFSGCAGRGDFCQPKSNHLRPESRSLRPVRVGVRFTPPEGPGQFPPRTDLPRGHPIPHLQRLPPGGGPHPVCEPRMPPQCCLPNTEMSPPLPRSFTRRAGNFMVSTALTTKG